jgi:hypothetical protein
MQCISSTFFWVERGGKGSLGLVGEDGYFETETLICPIWGKTPLCGPVIRRQLGSMSAPSKGPGEPARDESKKV